MTEAQKAILNKFVAAKKAGDTSVAPGGNDPETQLFWGKLQRHYLELTKLKDRAAENGPTFVKLALTHLKESKRNADYEAYELFKPLFNDLEYDNLGQELKTKMDSGIDLLEKRIDYFCSYTRKGLPDINSNYETIIYKALSVKQDTHPKEWQDNNYVAILLVKYLKDRSLSSYFLDIDKIKNGEIIRDEVYDFCARTTVLLLLAQQEAFRCLDGEINWCYREYKHYSDTHTNQRFQVFRVPGLTDPGKVPDEILKWYNKMTKSDGVKGQDLNFDLSNWQVRDRVNAVADEIWQAKEDSFQEFLATIPN